ncbi:MAG: GDP-mannose 4,6-dehydratase [Nanoarchaeota archaeon]
MEKLNIPSLSGKKILITGGCGFLGSTLAKRLVATGGSVTLFIKPGKDLGNVREIKEKISIIKGSLLDKNGVAKAVEGKDYLFHFAWQTDLKKSMENPQTDINSDIIGLVNILETCRKNNPNLKIIFASTVTLMDMTGGINYDEGVRENPLSIYDVNKFAAEKYLSMYFKIYGLKIAVLRLANVFGEGQRIDNPNRGVLNFMIGKALKGEKLLIYGEGDFIRDYSYVQNYIDAFILTAVSEKTNGGVFILGSGQGLKFVEVVNKIKEFVKEIAGKEVIVEHVPFPEGEHAISKRNFIADYSKLHRTTGWFPQISFEEGLKKTIEFFNDRVN